MELHKGTIGVTSEEGRGSKFKFTIPFEVASVVPEDSALISPADESMPLLASRERNAMVEMSTLPSLSPNESTTPTKPLEVLVVDDADSNRKMLAMLLKRKVG